MLETGQISLKRPSPSASLTPLAQASLKTADNLHTIAQRSQLSLPEVERLSLPELASVVEQVARLTPAGNVPGMILSGLARLPERRPPAKMVRRDLNLLFKGVEQTLDRAVFATFFAGPAAVIGAYQHLLKLAGKDSAKAFPEGTWQFYVEYAMREDTARHANETHGFDTFLRRHELHLNPVDRATAWAMAAIYCLHHYHDLLTNEWRERVATHLLVELTRHRPAAARCAHLYRRWEKQRPYGRPAGESRLPYPAYRRDCFDLFLAEAMADLDTTTLSQWEQAYRRAEAEDLPAFRQQMSILAYLDPGPYGETRTPIALNKASIGLIQPGCYFLIPVCNPGSDNPTQLQTVRAMVAAALDQTDQTGPTPPLARIKRSAWPDLRQKLDRDFVTELDRLRLAPILLNCDQRPRTLPLAEIRQGERGRGDHALTLFDTGQTMVFDQSHIFFDGAWGAALAEIMTQEAVYWARQLSEAVTPETAAERRPQKLAFHVHAADLTLLRQAPQVAVELAAETEVINLKAMVKLRRLFKQRSDLLQLTINDLLILYRAIHALTYQPAPQLVGALEELAARPESRQAALAALETLRPVEPVNPTILIPIDASQRTPQDRLYPLTFEAPLTQLDFIGLRGRVMAAWKAYQQTAGDRSAAYAEFDRLQREYLATLAGFGRILGQIKAVARAGESFSLGALKLLAHFPAPVQRLLEKIPDNFDLLNDLIKGREAFSNVGAVAPGSTLTRFLSAKDDNDKKTLVWGVLTDAQGVLHLTLRDFRPHGALLLACGQQALAQRLTQHYLNTYAEGLNEFVRELRQITQSNRETHLHKLG